MLRCFTSIPTSTDKEIETQIQVKQFIQNHRLSETTEVRRTSLELLYILQIFSQLS